MQVKISRTSIVISNFFEVITMSFEAIPESNEAAAPARFRDRQSPRRAAAASRVAKQTVAFVDVVDSEPGVILKPFEEGMAKVSRCCHRLRNGACASPAR